VSLQPEKAVGGNTASCAHPSLPTHFPPSAVPCRPAHAKLYVTEVTAGLVLHSVACIAWGIAHG